MSRLSILVVLLLGPAAAQASTEGALRPSQAMRPGQPPLATAARSLNAETIELTLSDAIYLGLRDNRSIRSAYMGRIAQKFDLRVAEDRFTPKLMLSANYLASRNNDAAYREGNLTPTTTLLTPYGTRISLGWTHRHTQTNQAGASRSDGASLALIQPLLRGAGKDIGTAPVRLARLSEEADRLNLKATVAQTITQVIAAYRMLLQAQEQLKIAKDSLQRARQLLEVNRALIEAGRMAAFEVVQTEAGVASQELAYEEARQQTDTARLALLQLLALNLRTPIIAVEALQAQRLEVDAAQALQQAEASQPGYLSLLIQREQARINLDVATNSRLWDVSLVGGASQLNDRSTPGSAGTWDHYVGVQVAIPIGDLSARQNEVQAQVSMHTQEIQADEARQQLEREVANGVRDIGTRWRQYEIAQRALDLSRRKLDIEREKLSMGRSSNFQVLSFENDLRNAENGRLNALISYLNAQAELDLTVGTTLQSWDISLND